MFTKPINLTVTLFEAIHPQGGPVSHFNYKPKGTTLEADGNDNEIMVTGFRQNGNIQSTRYYKVEKVSEDDDSFRFFLKPNSYIRIVAKKENIALKEIKEKLHLK